MSIIRKAPGKDLIPLIIKDKSYYDLLNFYNIRVDWYGYPLIHDGLMTYSLFDDLVNNFSNDKENISKLIDFAILIAEQERDEKFLNAIFFILDFCTIAKRLKIAPTQHQIERVVHLVDRVKKGASSANMTAFWEQILDFLSTNKEFNKTDYLVKDTNCRNKK